MDKQNIQKRFYTLLTTLIGVAVQTVLVFVVWYYYYNDRNVIQKIFVFKGHYFVMALYVIILYFFVSKFGANKIGYLKIGDLTFAHICAILATDVAFYAELCLLAYGFPNPGYLIAACCIQILVACIFVRLVTWGYRRQFPPHQVLLLYGMASVKEFLPKLATRKDKFEICESFRVDEKRLKEDKELCNVIKEKITHYKTIMLWDIPANARNELFKFCYSKGIRVYVMPKLSDIILTGAETMHFFDTPLFLTRSDPLSLEQLAVKRVFDLLLCVILLIPALPLMLLTAIAIKLYDGGPVLYKQIRCTTNEREFNIYKFRSMVVDAEKDGVAILAAKEDSRITPVGRFIRATRLDELPQLFNILKGDMSFVGPRPERPAMIRKYVEQIPEFVYRTKVKAGLTGYAQIFGKYNTTPYDKLKLDIYYIEHYSFGMDLKILIQTVKIIFTPEATEGVDSGKMTEGKKNPWT